MRFLLVGFSVNITALAGKVLGISKGGNTATAGNPGGTRANDWAKDGFEKSVGKPPPPGQRLFHFDRQQPLD